MLKGIAICQWGLWARSVCSSVMSDMSQVAMNRDHPDWERLFGPPGPLGIDERFPGMSLSQRWKEVLRVYCIQKHTTLKVLSIENGVVKKKTKKQKTKKQKTKHKTQTTKNKKQK